MKYFKFLISSMFMLILIFTSCEKDNESNYSTNIIGTWKVKTPLDECDSKYRLHIYSNGTFFGDDVCSEFDEVGHWEIHDNFLKITYDSFEQYDFTIISLTKSEMTIKFAGESQDYVKV